LNAEKADLHIEMVKSLAHSRALLLNSTSRADFIKKFNIEMIIAFDELKEENRWSWLDLSDLVDSTSSNQN
jgi:hypothetical protein